jgi:hypothetical protein
MHARHLALLAAAALLCACAEQHEGHEGHDAGHAGMPNEPAAMPEAALPDQPLVDMDGVPHGTLASPASGRWTGLIFVRTDCPVSNQYAPEIKRICGEYGPKGLQCLMVYADAYDTRDTVRRHRADFGYALPAILDPGHALVARAGATITPEVAVFAGAELAYSGRIDNLYNELGRPRQQVTERDLRDALDDLIAGRKVRKPRTPATGCFIE